MWTTFRDEQGRRRVERFSPALWDRFPMAFFLTFKSPAALLAFARSMNWKDLDQLEAAAEEVAA
jgi:hypothetical protein